MATLTPTSINTLGTKQTLAAATACGDRFRPASFPEFLRIKNAGAGVTVTIPTQRSGGAAPVNSVLTGNASSGQAVINVTAGNKFQIGNQCTLVDTAGRETVTVLSINANAITVDTNLVNSYTTARSATLWLGGADIVTPVAGGADVTIAFDNSAHTSDFIDDDGYVQLVYSSVTSVTIGLFQLKAAT